MKTNNKTHITETALKLFATKGYGNTSIAMIAKKAQVAQGALYNFYDSKEELLREILHAGFAQIELSMQSYAREKDPRKAISMHIESTFSLVEQNKEYWKLFHSIRLQEDVKNYLSKTFGNGSQNILVTLTNHFKKLKYANAAMEAKIFFATMDGLVNHYLVDEEEFSLRKIKKHLIQKYIL